MELDDKLAKCRIAITELMRQRGVHASNLAKQVRVPQPTIHRLLKGKTDDIKLSTLLSIADFFSIGIEQLLSNNPVTAKFKKDTCCRSIPVLSWKEATHNQEIASEISRSHICVSATFSNLAFAITAKPSMQPTFSKDSLLIIDPKLDVRDGDVVVVYYQGSSEATVRYLIIDGPDWLLKHVVRDSAEEVMNDAITMVGPVAQVISPFRNLQGMDT